MKKLLIGGTVVAALFGGAALGPTVVSANDETPSAPEEGQRQGPGAARHGMKHNLAEDLGIDADALRQGFEAGQTLAETLDANGIDRADAINAMTTAAETHIGEAVEAGRITQEEADARLAELPDHIEERLDADPSERGSRGKGQRGSKGKGQREGRGHGHAAEVFETLGLDPDTVREGLQSGMSLAEVAEANGVSQEELVAALVSESMDRIDTAIEAGKITEEQAEEKTANLEERITERVTAEHGEHQERGERGERGRRGGPRHRSGADDNAPGGVDA